MRMTDSENFHENYTPVPESGCWLWDGVIKRGYGNIKYKGRPTSAHRLSYTFYRGKIPDGMCVCHTCDVKSCVNPDHLFIGTHKDNTQDMIRKGRKAPTTGELNGQSALTVALVREIREASGTLVDIASKYGIAFQTVSRIKLKQRWGHV